ncbi:MAG: glycoside hydrolase family 3 C-terminal domain-containing protein [Sporocytophaga sp.]|uniref:glycoside hydrolase family 3 N-terminal domain-containing protein n=1 Tax=Sporocytophaga sp. TaxID=2231183 RepID=UPI001AFD47F1|nr:glycoside hydrolase family 3 N-terminal domain-containing protein [Sporocytophaga sp.]MBO9701740.1 glycoside hydrolase family 3 C-terminal domain-containing protein [Sporocytophaga sp.]
MFNFKSKVFFKLGLCVVCVIICSAWFYKSEDKPLYKNASLSAEERAADLLSRMTIEEKTAQLIGFWDIDGTKVLTGDSTFKEMIFKEIFKNGIGEIGPMNMPIEKDVNWKNAAQKFLVTKTRLGIPAIFHDEGCHGLMKPEATSFPMTIGLASSWDEKLFEEVYDVTAREMRSRGGHQALTPILDVGRDPRFGRIEEFYGEDPFLNSRLGAAQVKGLQGGNTGEVDKYHVLATLKHFTAHGSPEGGLNRSSGNISMRDLREIHIYPFQYVIEQSKPAAVMASYNEIDGVPSHANVWLLQDILRKELGFKGLIVSDYEGVRQLHADHKVAEGPKEAALQALKAGIQIELPLPDSYNMIPDLIKESKLDISLIDSYVKQILILKFNLGLFENPYVKVSDAITEAKKVESQKLALKAAQKSIILLKNKDNLLPLHINKYKKIAVIGPNADFAYLGGYSGTPFYNVSILDGIKKRAGNNVEILYAKGCEITQNHRKNSFYNWKHALDIKLATPQQNKPLIDEARKVASAADIVILVVGDNETTCREAWMKGHEGDRSSLDLLGSQNELINSIVATGKPVVIYLMGGRPLAIGNLKDNEGVRAILEGWYMGQETGNAAASILFGDIAPSGKLTVSLPKSAGHIPAYYSRKSMSRAFDYAFSDNEPLYAFGHGLSYVTFEYSSPRLSQPTMNRSGSVTLNVDVTNTGNMHADEVIQLYIRDQVASVTRPVKELKGFKRVTLNPGETKTVSFTINPSLLSFYDINMNYGVEPGKFTLMTGGNSTDLKSIELEVR